MTFIIFSCLHWTVDYTGVKETYIILKNCNKFMHEKDIVYHVIPFDRANVLVLACMEICPGRKHKMLTNRYVQANKSTIITLV